MVRNSMNDVSNIQFLVTFSQLQNSSFPSDKYFNKTLTLISFIKLFKKKSSLQAAPPNQDDVFLARRTFL